MKWDFNELIPIKPKLTIKKSIKTPSGSSKPSLIKPKPPKGVETTIKLIKEPLKANVEGKNKSIENKL